MQTRRLSVSVWRFQQVSSTIGWRVMELQSDGKQVAHAGLSGKSTLQQRCSAMPPLSQQWPCLKEVSGLSLEFFDVRPGKTWPTAIFNDREVIVRTSSTSTPQQRQVQTSFCVLTNWGKCTEHKFRVSDRRAQKLKNEAQQTRAYDFKLSTQTVARASEVPFTQGVCWSTGLHAGDRHRRWNVL